jgi:hypothetical protein
MDARGGRRQHLPMPPDIERLSDEFGQYDLELRCGACGHQRTTLPESLARIFGWSAKLADVAARLRCSRCDAKRCELRAFRPRKPKGYSSLPK